jgi:DNA mismatch repair protein MLH3
MFNDVLSLSECADLVERLGKCAFPFMCAHGRVSMVPIGMVGGGPCLGFGGARESDGAGEVASKISYVDAWKKWKGDDGVQ